MPKTIKQKNNYRVIDSYCISILSLIELATIIIITFSNRRSLLPEIVIAIKAPSNNKKAKPFPNAFITYKKALIKENRIRNIKLPPMGQLSKIVSLYLNEEPENVKEFYRSISEKAKSLYKQNEIQIVFDKHMNEVDSDQRGTHLAHLAAMDLILAAHMNYANNTQTKEVEDMIHAPNSSSGYLTIEDSTIGVMTPCYDNGTTSISHVENCPKHNFLGDPNDQEYKQMLMQININLFIHDLRQNYLYN
ncbi:4110_t:CDS:1 [Funneliformis geosporum]|uniref:9164_t:CDS:1 n=1 Tax=Funneliformis geosporum TaxID=1117311 RepID=A0A9W4T2D1_9GLOM|nr:9164_t:CDS:1 [Funneliformis geosporum]CAI2190339.1 4110_t:CDS:1 [Funneliformis geosporum]